MELGSNAGWGQQHWSSAVHQGSACEPRSLSDMVHTLCMAPLSQVAMLDLLQQTLCCSQLCRPSTVPASQLVELSQPLSAAMALIYESISELMDACVKELRKYNRLDASDLTVEQASFAGKLPPLLGAGGRRHWGRLSD